jgi:hypothetical protein
VELRARAADRLACATAPVDQEAPGLVWITTVGEAGTGAQPGVMQEHPR